MSKLTPGILCGVFLGKNAIDMQIESFTFVFIFRDKRWFHGILAVIKKNTVLSETLGLFGHSRRYFARLKLNIVHVS